MWRVSLTLRIWYNWGMKDQLGLFKKKGVGKAISRQVIELKEPTADSTVMGTLAAYHTYLKSGSYSSYTADDFLGDVKKLAFYLPNKKLSGIATLDLQNWISVLKSPSGENLTAKTVSRKITAIKNYFLWLAGNGVLEENPADRLANQRITSPLPDVLFEAECQNLINEASKNSRTYLLVLLLLETGLKKEELFNLEVKHFDFSNKYKPEMLVMHEGKKIKKDRKLKLPPEIVSVFDDYISSYKIEDKLFPYTPRTIEYLLKETSEQAQVKKKVTAQILRDTFAIRQLKRGEKLETVLEKLGLNPGTWEDAKEKYLKLSSPAL